MPTARPAIRLVVPVHDEGPFLAAFLGELVEAAAGVDAPPTHVVVVDDGSGPVAAEEQAGAVRSAARRLAQAGSPHTVELVVAEANEGKGAAIRRGWGDGAGAEWLAFVDGDGAVPAREVWRLAALVADRPAADALVSARRAGAGRRVVRKPLRHLQGRVFAAAVEAVLGLGLHDPQCGLKFFRAAHLAPALPALRERRWLIDLELLLAVARAGARIAEEPIDWHERGRSRLVAGVDPLRMLAGLLRLRARHGRRGPPAAG